MNARTTDPAFAPFLIWLGVATRAPMRADRRTVELWWAGGPGGFTHARAPR